ncbi:UpxY family transcription antiterminator [Flavihumibacter stibioxidans]|uniref:UpxY family transcription antiterminator n=1 Tax=Flavihumibacter stibioxidans TaxID=1834163 RepID=UPI0031B58236
MSTELKPKTWYALYTKPRWEKKVHELMLRRGVESYCPLNKVRRKWSDRYKVIEEPLFKSYLFVHIAENQKTEVRYVDGVVNYVYWLGKPAKLKAEEIARIKRFLGEHTDVKVIQVLEPKPGDKVIITSGAFMENEGTILSADKKWVEVRIDSLGFKLVAQMEKEKVIVKS